MFFNFAVHYANTHDVIDPEIHITDDILEDFKQYLAKREYTYKHPIEKALDNLKREAIDSRYAPSLLKDVDQLKKSLDKLKDEMLITNKEDIQFFLKAELASKFLGTKKAVEIELKDDLVVQKALQVLKDEDFYTSILN